MPLFENLKKITEIENNYDNSTPQIKHHKDPEDNITYSTVVYHNQYNESDTIILLKLFNLHKINQLNEEKLKDLVEKINNSQSLKNFIELLKTLPINIKIEIDQIQNDQTETNNDVVIKINI